MLTGPLAGKRKQKITITRRQGPDDDSTTLRILPPQSSSDDGIDSILIPLLSDDTIMPGGPVITEPQFAAYIDDLTQIRTGDIVRRVGTTQPDLYVIGVFVGDISQRIDLSESPGGLPH